MEEGTKQKRFAVFLFASLFLFSFVNVHAAEIEPAGTPLRKLQRGFLNIALSPIEISTQLAKEKKNDLFPPSWVFGFLEGGTYMVGRTLTGAYEILTFPISLPGNYAPILHPEFEWEHFDNSKIKDQKSN